MIISTGISSAAAPDGATLEGAAAGGAATQGKLVATRMIADAAARKHLRGHFRITEMASDLGEHEGRYPLVFNTL